MGGLRSVTEQPSRTARHLAGERYGRNGKLAERHGIGTLSWRNDRLCSLAHLANDGRKCLQHLLGLSSLGERKQR